MNSPFAALVVSLLVSGWGWGVATVFGQSTTEPEKTSSTVLAAEEQRLTFSQPKLPWWVRDMRLQGRSPAPDADLRQVLAENRGREAVKSLLGDNSWRRLDGARFALEVDSLGFTRDPEEDRDRTNQVERVLRSNFVKLTREALESRLGVEEFAERALTRVLPKRFADDREEGDRRADGLHLRVSPRLSVGHRNRVGFKLRAAGLGSPLLRGAYLKAVHDLDDANTRLVLAFEHPGRDRDVYLEYRSDDHRQGEYVSLSFRFSY